MNVNISWVKNDIARLNEALVQVTQTLKDSPVAGVIVRQTIVTQIVELTKQLIDLEIKERIEQIVCEFEGWAPENRNALLRGLENVIRKPKVKVRIRKG